MPIKPSLYDVLGLDPTATPEQVRKAYKVKALETHPDKLDPGASEQLKELAEKRFHQVHEAFEILNDPHKRRAYDSRTFRTRATSLPSPSMPYGYTDDLDRLMKDRAEWARQQQARYQPPRSQSYREARSPTAQASASAPLPTKPKPQPVVPPTPKTPEEEENTRLVESMMQGLRQLDPEWEKRRMSVLKRRAERMTSTTRSSTVRS
ncbi:hypothetical protein V5O48_004454 [Marasmius crinis-equi]|uniref:J domain-containing protein n=1 Tax=Marasmius crinis-equi TaxID=585013 RepID=A0ABR3FPY7_9AGAR